MQSGAGRGIDDSARAVRTLLRTISPVPSRVVGDVEGSLEVDVDDSVELLLLIDISMWSRRMPALLTTMSSPPKASIAR